MKMFLAAIVAMLVFPQTGSAEDEKVRGLVRAMTGDVLIVGGTPVRLFGIDALELDQTCSNILVDDYPCGRYAVGRVNMMLLSEEVHCALIGDDIDYEIGDHVRIGRCYLRELDLAEWVVRSGYAMALRSESDEYVAAEDAARVAEMGLWGGPYVAPWEWREGARPEKIVRAE